MFDISNHIKWLGVFNIVVFGLMIFCLLVAGIAPPGSIESFFIIAAAILGCGQVVLAAATMIEIVDDTKPKKRW